MYPLNKTLPASPGSRYGEGNGRIKKKMQHPKSMRQNGHSWVISCNLVTSFFVRVQDVCFFFFFAFGDRWSPSSPRNATATACVMRASVFALRAMEAKYQAPPGRCVDELARNGGCLKLLDYWVVTLLRLKNKVLGHFNDMDSWLCLWGSLGLLWLGCS